MSDTTAYDDELVRRHGYAEDGELDGPATPDTIRSHIASLETAATEEAEAGFAFSAGLLVLRAEAWRRRIEGGNAAELAVSEEA